MRQAHPRSGFTYIELMTACAIIVILAAILFPVFARAREKGRQIACVSQLNQISTALHIYASDYHEQLPPRGDDLTPVYPYLRELDVFHCPSDNPPKAVRLSLGRLLNVSYQYRGGLSPLQGRASRTAVLCDRNRRRHYEGANYLFLDGRVKSFSAASFPGPRPAPHPELGVPFENPGGRE